MKQVITLAIVVIGLTASQAPAQSTLRYQFKKGDKLRYVLDQETTTTISVKGEEKESRQRILWDLAWSVAKVDDAGAATLEIKITRARLFLEGPEGRAAADSDDKNEPEDALRKSMAVTVKVMAAMELHGTMLPTGEMKNVKATEESIKAVKDLSGAKKEVDLLDSDFARSMQFATVLPSEALAKGKTWTKNIEATTPFGKTIIDNIYTAADSVEKDGLTLEKASVKLAVTFKADEKSKVKTEIKDVKSNGYLLFDNKAGRLMETVLNQRTEMVLEGMGMTVNQTIEQSLTVRLKTK